MSLYCLDANIFIMPWEKDYPFSVFPTLWKQISKHKDKFIILKNIYDQIDPPASGIKREELKQKHPLRKWLKENEIQISSLHLEKKYKILPEGITKGADQNDMILISYSKENNKTVVTLESYQNNIPKEFRNYKIPLICEKEGVPCINYVDFLKKLKISI